MENHNKDSKSKSGVSRRGFLRGAGLTTAGSVLLTSKAFALKDFEPKTSSTLIGPDHSIVQIKVNGSMYEIKAEPRTTLATALRNQMGLSGTKIVCDRGSCSACTVYLDGKPVNSCMMSVFDVGNQEVTSIEGIAKNGKLHPVQEEFITQDASQCGYCTPGMIMSCVHLLENNPKPTLEDVKKATRGNLCRCGTYPHVFKATLEASKKMK
jgi:carbon-monoxide dehydrogenase small subunit/xanthine dehydrogenase YagT iron-sulfur-binding subunit